MARIAGINLPSQKRVEIALQSIYGIGSHKARQICDDSKIASATRVSQLSEKEIAAIRSTIEKNHAVEGDRRREVGMDIKRLMDLGCYRGIRHRKSLPVHGQRTHTNARTRKGKAVTIAGKKKVTR